MLKIGFIGEAMVEVRGALPGPLTQDFSGDTFNTAVYAQRLLQDQAQVAYLSAIGDDEFSAGLRRRLQAEGIGDQFLLSIPGRTLGLYFIHVDLAGERSFTYWRGEAAARDAFSGPGSDKLLAALAGFDVLYLSGISLAVLRPAGRELLLRALSDFVDAGGQLVFDNNYRPRLWESPAVAAAAFNRVLALAHTAILTFDDDRAVFGSVDLAAAEARLAGNAITELIFKCGADPARVCVRGPVSQKWDVPAEPVARVVDTTAAGDAFSAAYLAARVRGATPVQAAGWGHALAAAVIQVPGAIIPPSAMPTMPSL